MLHSSLLAIGRMLGTLAGDFVELGRASLQGWVSGRGEEDDHGKGRMKQPRRRFLHGTFALAALGLLGGCGTPLGPLRQRSSIPRLGFLVRVPFPEEPPAAFWDALNKLGYVDGQTITVDARSAKRVEELPGLAAELVSLKPDVLVGAGNPTATPLKRATDTIPIVITSLGDPVQEGLAASLAHPGGNLTGSTLLAPDLGMKRIELLKETVPGVRRIGVLRNPEASPSLAEWQQVQDAATVLGMEIQALDVRQAEDLDRAFESAVSWRVEALMSVVDALIGSQSARIAAFALRQRLPTMHYATLLVQQGGLLSYGVNHPAAFRRAATYVDKILRGAKPADLPIEQPSTFELAVNLATARALGITVPESILLQATEVIP